MVFLWYSLWIIFILLSDFSDVVFTCPDGLLDRHPGASSIAALGGPAIAGGEGFCAGRGVREPGPLNFWFGTGEKRFGNLAVIYFHQISSTVAGDLLEISRHSAKHFLLPCHVPCREASVVRGF